jgi:hypothetical protein
MKLKYYSLFLIGFVPTTLFSQALIYLSNGERGCDDLNGSIELVYPFGKAWIDSKDVNKIIFVNDHALIQTTYGFSEIAIVDVKSLPWQDFHLSDDATIESIAFDHPNTNVEDKPYFQVIFKNGSVANVELLKKVTLLHEGKSQEIYPNQIQALHFNGEITGSLFSESEKLEIKPSFALEKQIVARYPNSNLINNIPLEMIESIERIENERKIQLVKGKSPGLAPTIPLQLYKKEGTVLSHVPASFLQTPSTPIAQADSGPEIAATEAFEKYREHRELMDAQGKLGDEPWQAPKKEEPPVEVKKEAVPPPAPPSPQPPPPAPPVPPAPPSPPPVPAPPAETPKTEVKEKKKPAKKEEKVKPPAPKDTTPQVPKMIRVKGEGNVKSFLIAETPVTNEQYKKFVNAVNYRYPSHWVGGQIPEGMKDEPVVNVFFKDAYLYALWIGKRLPKMDELKMAESQGILKGESSSLKEWTSTLDPSKNLSVLKKRLFVSGQEEQTLSQRGDDSSQSVGFRIAGD